MAEGDEGGAGGEAGDAVGAVDAAVAMHRTSTVSHRYPSTWRQMIRSTLPRPAPVIRSYFKLAHTRTV